MGARKTYKVRAKVVVWPGEQGAWHMMHVDRKLSATIRGRHGKIKRGFGSIPVMAKIGKTSWETAIFFDKRSETYILPLKLKIRRAESLAEGDTIAFTLSVRA